MPLYEHMHARQQNLDSSQWCCRYIPALVEGCRVQSLRAVPVVQEGAAAAQLPGQLPEHQQHAHGHQVPAGAAAATGSSDGAGSGAADQQQAGSSASGGQPASGSGNAGSGPGGRSGSGSAGGGGGSGGQGAGGSGGDGPGRGHSGAGGTGAAGAESQGRSAEQQVQQGQQTSQAQPAGSWAAANYGYVWNMPQWVPATSMALFAPAMGYQHLQYAGQTHPASVAPELQVS